MGKKIRKLCINKIRISIKRYKLLKRIKWKFCSRKKKWKHTIGVECSPESFNIKLTNQKKEFMNLKKSHWNHQVRSKEKKTRKGKSTYRTHETLSSGQCMNYRNPRRIRWKMAENLPEEIVTENVTNLRGKTKHRNLRNLGKSRILKTAT